MHGTSQVIPSHSMGLTGIAATVPETFGIPNIPMDICWQCWTCGPLISLRTKPVHGSLFIMEFHYNFTYKFCQLNPLTPNDTLICVIAKARTIWLVFFLLRVLAGNALRRILVAMVELSSDEPTRSSRRARGALPSVYFCVLSSPTG